MERIKLTNEYRCAMEQSYNTIVMLQQTPNHNDKVAEYTDFIKIWEKLIGQVIILEEVEFIFELTNGTMGTLDGLATIIGVSECGWPLIEHGGHLLVPIFKRKFFGQFSSINYIQYRIQDIVNQHLYVGFGPSLKKILNPYKKLA
jgi:hypothetical protein